MDINYEVGKRIRKLRESQNISIPELALSSGISYSHLKNLENGNKGIEIDMLIKIVDTLGFDLFDLFNN